MPKLGMKPVRRQALIGATIAEIHERGSLDVTVSQIARRAGVSSALAHHYFGAKEDLILASMRHLLALLHADVTGRLTGTRDGLARARAIIRANIGEKQFAPDVVSAWLAFYVMAQSNPRARRLLRVYFGRLQSNLTDALVRRLPRDQARRIAETTAALIDGFFIRRALREDGADPESAASLIEEHIDAQVAYWEARRAPRPA